MGKQYLSVNHLKKFIPLRSLASADLERVRRNSPIVTVAANEILYKRKTRSQDLVYLVKGKAKLIDDQDHIQLLSANSEQAHFPIVIPPMSKSFIKTITKSIILRVNQDLLKVLDALQQDARAGLFSSDALENKIFHELHAAYVDDRLTLPSLPDLAQRINSALQNPNANAKEVARILQVDPAITAKVLQVANSPLHRGVTAIKHCSDAVSRLGFAGTRNIVLSFTLNQLFQSKHKILKAGMQTLWQHSADVAAMSYILAKATKGFDPDYAMLAGLLHDIGAVVIISHAGKYPDLITDSAQLEHTITTLCGQIGAMLLKRWGFDEALVTVAAESEKWMRDPTPQADYCDIILLAQMHSHIGTARMRELPVINEVPAFNKVALGKLSPQRSLLVLDKAKAEVNAIKQLLGVSH